VTAAATAAPPIGPLFLGHELYRRSSYGAGHPLAVPRVSTVMDLARALGWLPPGRYRTSPTAKPAALALFHSPDYIAALAAAEATQQVTPEIRARFGLGTVANPVFPEMFRRPATAAGGALLAAELIAGGGVVFHPAGGTHHGRPDRASGFCYVNDPALAILGLRGCGLRRIAYIDLDAHHPDGVEAAFAGDPEILMISVHEEGRWPFTGDIGQDAGGSAFNLPVPRGFNDSEMRAVLHELILPRVAGFAPEALVIQCGADALAEDPLSRLALSNNAHAEVVAALLPLAPRVLVTGGGGYNPWTVGRLWTRVWAVLTGAELPDRLPEPAAAVLRGLRFARQRGPVPEYLTETLADAPREGPVRSDLRARLARLARR
jgi:acetoin utilization protein AcuC